MAQQTKSITSEALEAAYRSLTPSQEGFTEDLMASNTIVPVLDLTASAQGTSTPQNLQTAIAFGSQTAFEVANTTTVLANTAGFFRIFGVVTQPTSAGVATTATFQMSDGLSTKNIWRQSTPAIYANFWINMDFDFIVFLRSGDSISAISDNISLVIAGSTRQVADVNGTLVYPVGFTPQ